LDNFPRQQNRHIGILGLGVGTVAAFGRAGDRLRFYELNPEVWRIAREPFTYLSNCLGRVDVVLGDARLSMEREVAQQFDFLAMDAFSSDAIPVHLLTKEAFEIYLRHLKPDGVILVHISNRYLNLAPVVRNVAAHFDLKLAIIDDGEGEEWWQYESTWVLLTRNKSLLDCPAIRDATSAPDKSAPIIPLWTDDYASLFPILD